jgi:hypothetical protein
MFFYQPISAVQLKLSLSNESLIVETLNLIDFNT